jgi:hypothetical protein
LRHLVVEAPGKVLLCYAISQLRAIANRLGKRPKTSSNLMMIRPHRHALPGLIGVVLLLGLSACSEAVTLSDSPPSSAALQRQYQKALTKAEQEAMISDLQKAAAKKDEAKAEKAVMTGPAEN